MTCPRSNSEREHPESGLRPSDFGAWGHDHSSISPRLPSDWLWEILRQTGAAGSVEGINIPWINWKDPATPRVRPWGAGPSDQRPTCMHSLSTSDRAGISFCCEAQLEVVALHFSFTYASCISSVYL